MNSNAKDPFGVFKSPSTLFLEIPLLPTEHFAL